MTRRVSKSGGRRDKAEKELTESEKKNLEEMGFMLMSVSDERFIAEQDIDGMDNEYN